MKNGTLWAVIALIIILLLGGWWYLSMKDAAPGSDPEVAGESEENLVDGSKDGAPAGMEGTTIYYDSDGFSPSTVTITKGTVVTFVNRGTDEMWIGSDEHPSHTQYDGTSKDDHCEDGVPSTTTLDQCGVGSSYRFTFDKVGTWSYHNHRDDDHRGTIVVTD